MFAIKELLMGRFLDRIKDTSERKELEGDLR